MKVEGSGDKDLRGLNHQLHEGHKTAEDGIMREQNLIRVDDLKVNGIAQNVNEGHGRGLQVATSPQISQQQQQSQGSIVCWEKFLHVRSLKVLLVENDDSTRHVVTALLRNCSYEVIEASNGLQAWKILENLNNHVDIVLTEVVMPFSSGIALLCKIMSHKTRRNVPVIMMSSHDSMGLVLKCLSKGAVDFLVKPIRKNELKNLWQHVWRRCHSSSGSGSESATQTQQSVRSKSVDKSDNNSGSNYEDDSGSIGLNEDGSDKGSGTQSSWTKQAIDIDSPLPTSPSNNVAECPDSTCAQVIHSNGELSGSKQIPVTDKIKHCKLEEELENITTGKDMVMNMERNLDLRLEYPVEDPIALVGMNQKDLLEKGSSKVSEQPIDKQLLDLNCENLSSKSKYKATNHTSIIIKGTEPLNDCLKFEASNKHAKIMDTKCKAICDDKDAPSLELSLKRLRGIKDIGTAVHDDRNVLRRSDSSAFSRYNSALNTNQTSKGNMKSCSPCDISLGASRKGLVYDLQSHSCGDRPNQGSNVGSNNIDTGSTTNNTYNQSVLGENKPAVTSTFKRLHPAPIFQPMKGDILCTSKQIVTEKDDDVTGAEVLAQSSDILHESQSQHRCDYHHLLQNTQQNQLPPGLGDSLVNKLAVSVPHCSSSNVPCGPTEGNTGNYSINGSASGSNHGSNHVSNGQNGSTTGVNAGGTNIEGDNRIGGKSGSGDASGSGSGNRADQDKLAQRKAALTKFRQKRSERCFRKKVRYQSRKTLAEQRPRVRGQFVRQTAKERNESSSRATES
ncbi:hypothetical protein K2173_001946 [Erythroxylum novogranatense]|uniref:Two-component response regulator-like APRR7 n=1 Tax=Erythroxylum novogranatense TaxID=1862640 RepID=A0AAV8SPC5_9ROSI|nr:hypothetical protein K2173_001946 [Erythroxylum novogranatense]